MQSSATPTIRQSMALLSCILFMYLAFFGFRAELILFLTRRLGYSDNHAYQIFGTFTGICALTPLIGGFLVDQKIDLSFGVFAAGVILILGYLLIHIEPLMNFALALLVLGIGVFDAFIICLIARYYGDHPDHKASIMTYYYIFMNIGGLIGSPGLAMISKYYGYHMSFVFASLCIGFAMFLLLLSLPSKMTYHKISLKAWLSFILVLVSIVFIICYDLAGYLIIVTILYTLISSKLFKRENKYLIPLGVMSLFALCYWILGQQPAGSINLFMARNINLHGIPAPVFQATDPIVIIFMGPVIAWLWHYLHKKKIVFTYVSKVLTGLSLLCIGFLCLWLGGLSAQTSGRGLLVWPLAALALIGFSELFINPVFYSEITSQVPEQIRGRCTALFLTITGAPGNFLAAKLADVTAGQADKVSQIEAAKFFTKAYSQMFLFGICVLIALLIFSAVWRLSASDH